MEGAWAWVNKIIDNVLGWFSKTWDNAKDWYIDLAWEIFDSFLSAFQAVIEAIPVPAAWSQASGFWSSLPGQSIWLFGAVKGHLVLAVIFGAYGVRFLLNLVPSWATRA